MLNEAAIGAGDVVIDRASIVRKQSPRIIVLGVGLGVLVGVVIFVVMPWIVFGSPDSLPRILQGRPLKLSMLPVASNSRENEYRLTLTNVGAAPIQVLGIVATCDCVITDSQPRQLDRKSQYSVAIKQAAPVKGVNGEVVIRVLTDVSTQAEVALSYH